MKSGLSLTDFQVTPKTLEVASLRNVPLSVLNWTTNENIEILRHAEGISVLWSGALDVVQMTTSSCKYSVNTFAVVIPDVTSTGKMANGKLWTGDIYRNLLGTTPASFLWNQTTYRMSNK
jgi:hypothetical protein